MGVVDVAIPAVIGGLMVAAPGMFTAKKASKEVHERNARRFKTMGMVLLAVAGLYLALVVANK